MNQPHRLIKVYLVESDPGHGDPFVVGANKLKLPWIKHRFRKEVLITRAHARRIIRAYNEHYAVGRWARDVINT